MPRSALDETLCKVKEEGEEIRRTKSWVTGEIDNHFLISETVVLKLEVIWHRSTQDHSSIAFWSDFTAALGVF